MYGRAFHPASPQLPGQVLIASTTGSGLSPNNHRYRSISNSAGRSPKPMGRGGLLTNVALSCSVKNFSQTRSAIVNLPSELTLDLSSSSFEGQDKLQRRGAMRAHHENLLRDMLFGSQQHVAQGISLRQCWSRIDFA